MSYAAVPDDEAWLARALAALEAEHEAADGAASSGGAQLYDKRDLPRLALQELARRKLKALGLDPDAPQQGKHSKG